MLLQELIRVCMDPQHKYHEMVQKRTEKIFQGYDHQLTSFINAQLLNFLDFVCHSVTIAWIVSH